MLNAECFLTFPMAVCLKEDTMALLLILLNELVMVLTGCATCTLPKLLSPDGDTAGFGYLTLELRVHHLSQISNALF